MPLLEEKKLDLFVELSTLLTYIFFGLDTGSEPFFLLKIPPRLSLGTFFETWFYAVTPFDIILLLGEFLTIVERPSLITETLFSLSKLSKVTFLSFI